VEVTLEFWGPLERLAGAKSRALTLAQAAPTVADVLAELARQMPELAERLERAAVALGDRLLQRRELVSAGARLALLPPVAGG
jgi:molybdopterin converting factor small subunit